MAARHTIEMDALTRYCKGARQSGIVLNQNGYGARRRFAARNDDIAVSWASIPATLVSL